MTLCLLMFFFVIDALVYCISLLVQAMLLSLLIVAVVAVVVVGSPSPVIVELLYY